MQALKLKVSELQSLTLSIKGGASAATTEDQACQTQPSEATELAGEHNVPLCLISLSSSS